VSSKGQSIFTSVQSAFRIANSVQSSTVLIRFDDQDRIKSYWRCCSGPMHNGRSAILAFDPKKAPANPFGIPKYVAGSLGHGRGVRLPSVATAVHFVSVALDHADLFILRMALFGAYFGFNGKITQLERSNGSF
jgi:hypothetical protein